MKKNIFSIFILLAAAFSLILGSGLSYGQEKIRLKYAGGTEGSGTYRCALAISEIVNKYSKRLEIAVQVSPGTLETPRMLEAGMVQLSSGSSSGEIMSTEGRGRYKDKPTKMVRRLMVWGVSIAPFFAPVEKNIKSTDDLVGKKIGLGPSTTPAGQMAANVLEIIGLKGKAKWYFNSSTNELGERIKDGIYDCGLYGVSHPWSVLLDLTSKKKLNFFGMSRENLKKVVEFSKGRYFPVKMPANIYPNQTKSFETYGSLQTTLVRADVPEDVALEILNILDDHFGEFKTAYPPAGISYHDFEVQAIKQAPFHPATIKWMKKHGVTVR